MKSQKSRRRFRVATWQLCLIFVPLAFLALTFLRLDHIRMVELRDAVLAADESGDTEALSSSLLSLKNFVTSHTVVNFTESNGNTELILGTEPFYLESSYLRDAEAAILEAESKLNDGEVTNNIYLEASNTCKPQAAANGWHWNSQGYINCMTSELAKTPAAADIVDSLTADVPSTELYRVEYSSPVISFTLSGITILICLIMLVVIFTRFVIWAVIRLSLLFL